MKIMNGDHERGITAAVLDRWGPAWTDTAFERPRLDDDGNGSMQSPDPMRNLLCNWMIDLDA